MSRAGSRCRRSTTGAIRRRGVGAHRCRVRRSTSSVVTRLTTRCGSTMHWRYYIYAVHNRYAVQNRSFSFHTFTAFVCRSSIASWNRRTTGTTTTRTAASPRLSTTRPRRRKFGYLRSCLCPLCNTALAYCFPFAQLSDDQKAGRGDVLENVDPVEGDACEAAKTLERKCTAVARERAKMLRAEQLSLGVLRRVLTAFGRMFTDQVRSMGHIYIYIYMFIHT